MFSPITISLIGFAGALLMAFCGAPQAITAIKQKHAKGVSAGFVWMWFIGELFLLAYVGLTTADPILMINYVMNIVLVSIIMFYMYFPKNRI